MVKKNSAAASNRFAPRSRDVAPEIATVGETFRKDKPEKRTQLSIAVERKFRDRLVRAARATGVTQRDFVVEAVERLIEEKAEAIAEYNKELDNQ